MACNVTLGPSQFFLDTASGTTSNQLRYVSMTLNVIAHVPDPETILLFAAGLC